MKTNSFHHLALYKVLKEERLNRKVSQANLAKKLGVQQSFISKYEAGERTLDLVELQTICGVLKISLITLIKKYEKEIKNIYGTK